MNLRSRGTFKTATVYDNVNAANADLRNGIIWAVFSFDEHFSLDWDSKLKKKAQYQMPGRVWSASVPNSTNIPKLKTYRATTVPSHSATFPSPDNISNDTQQYEIHLKLDGTQQQIALVIEEQAILAFRVLFPALFLFLD